jgi:oxygen-independent coproporphyrinogen-3 oxidase
MTPRDRHLFWLFWQFYNANINPKEFTQEFNQKFAKSFSLEMKLARLLGIAELTDKDTYHLTSRGIFLFHIVEQAFTHSYLDKVWQKCMSEAWPERILLS